MKNVTNVKSQFINGHHRTPEKVGITQIKISVAKLRSTVVVGSFTAANQILRAWSKSSELYFECDFELYYVDGLKFRGTYPIWKKSAEKLGLANFLRRNLSENHYGFHCVLVNEIDALNAEIPQTISEYFLEDYDVEDFSEETSSRDFI